MTTCLDTNVLIDLTTPDAERHAWAAAQFEARKAQGPVIIADIVYSEFSVTFDTQHEVDEVIAALALERYQSPDAALFRAGKAFRQYKSQNKGPKLGVLPDFLIGAVAIELGVPLLTANPGDYPTYFPGLALITP